MTGFLLYEDALDRTWVSVRVRALLVKICAPFVRCTISYCGGAAMRRLQGY
jgi:hypothetical protein